MDDSREDGRRPAKRRRGADSRGHARRSHGAGRIRTPTPKLCGQRSPVQRPPLILRQQKEAPEPGASDFSHGLPEAAFFRPDVLNLDDRHARLSPAPEPGVAEPSEAEGHHRPGRGLGDRADRNVVDFKRVLTRRQGHTVEGHAGAAPNRESAVRVGCGLISVRRRRDHASGVHDRRLRNKVVFIAKPIESSPGFAGVGASVMRPARAVTMRVLDVDGLAALVARPESQVSSGQLDLRSFP